MERAFPIRTAMPDEAEHSLQVWPRGISGSRIDKSSYPAHGASLSTKSYTFLVSSAIPSHEQRRRQPAAAS